RTIAAFASVLPQPLNGAKRSCAARFAKPASTRSSFAPMTIWSIRSFALPICASGEASLRRARRFQRIWPVREVGDREVRDVSMARNAVAVVGGAVAGRRLRGRPAAEKEAGAPLRKLEHG